VKRILAFLLVVSLVVGPSPAWAKSFSDTGGYWAEKDILRLANLGLSDGYQGKFLPKGQVTRAEFAKLVVTALGLARQAQVVAKARSPFSDLPSTHWANGYILVAYEHKLINGYNNYSFRPDAPINRVEIAALLMRALNTGTLPVGTLPTGISGSEKITGLPFADAETIPDWSRSTLSEAVQRGIISGYEDKTFRPLQPASRAESAVLVSRLLAQLGKQTDYQGTVKDLDRSGRSFILQVANQVSVFSLAEDAVFYRGNNRIAWKDVPLDSKLAVILDKNGKAAYLELLTSKVKNEFQPLSLNMLRNNNQQSINKSNLLDKSNLLVKSSFLDEANLLAETAATDFGSRPEASLITTQKEMKVDQLVKATGANGNGQLIAIIDTGVDPAHPDLQATENGKLKIVQWVDFTDEGKLNTSAEYEAFGASIAVNNQYLGLPEGISKSGKVHVGVWQETALQSASGKGVDLNGNGKATDVYNVLVVDQAKAGVYDTVIVDTNLNQDFRDEIPLKPYNDSKQYAKFTRGDGKRLGFVLTKIKEDGSEIKLGFDSNGHGTHVAGIAAASGRISGVAPGAQLMVIKAMDGEGVNGWSTIAEAINYAANQGAKIVNLSLGVESLESVGNNGANHLLRVLADTGVIFVVAAGNSGPGLNTMTTPADTGGIISVGAYISPAMWKQDYNWEVAKESLWFFSSIGPRFDGAMMPLITAPGSAVSTASWGGYRLSEGTSMAAPHVTGAVALLLENAQRNKIAYTPATVRQALSMGAKPMEGYTEVEQGYGKIDLVTAWQHLQQISEQPLIIPKVYHYWLKLGSGLYAREFVPGRLNFQFESLAQSDTVLNLRTTQPWLKPAQELLTLPKLATREISVDYRLPVEPGLHTARILGQIAEKQGTALEILNTVINPYYLNEANNYRQYFRRSIPAGQFQRYFFRVPEGTKNLNISLDVAQNYTQYLGRARLHIYNPKGQEVDQDLYDFAGVDVEQPQSVVEKQVPAPEPGTWEVVVYSSATLSQFNLTESAVELTVEAKEVAPSGNTGSESNYLVGLNEGSYPGERPEYVTFNVRKRNGLTPYDGVMEINSRLYTVTQGRVTIRVPVGLEPVEWTIGLPE
jgi:subtilisin family serine protease